MRLLCNICEVSESGYYKWLKRQSTKTVKDIEDETIIEAIRAIQKKHKYRYGVSRMTEELKSVFGCNHKRIYRLMRENNLLSRIKARKKYYGKKEKIPTINVLNRDFNSDSPFTKLVTDITEFKVRGKKIYLSAIKDLCTNVIEGYEISNHPTLNFVNRTIDQIKEKVNKEVTILHSDQGIHYTHSHFRKVLKESGIIQSFSRSGNPLDNAPIESFFGTLKSEVLYNNYININSAKQLVDEIHEHIYYYNNERIQKGLGYLTPNQFKMKKIERA